MSFRNELIELNFKNGPPNSVLGWNNAGEPIAHGIFGGASAGADGTIGLVPKPLLGQQALFLRADGVWAPAGGGGGTITGAGVANQLTFWSGATAIAGDSTLTFDGTNKILKASTFNASRATIGGGVTDGDFLYDVSTLDFRARINGTWNNITKQDEKILDAGVTNYTILESDRNTIIRTTASSTVTINLSALSNKYGVTVTKGGTGNVVFTGGTMTSMNGATSISLQYGSAHLYHSTDNNWRLNGALGTTGLGTVTNVTLNGVAGIIGVSNPSISTSGTIQLTLNTQAPATFLAGPNLGAANAVPTFRVLNVDDMPLFVFKAVDAGTTINLNATNDRGRVVDLSAVGAILVNLPNSFPIGWYAFIYKRPTAGTVTFANTGGGSMEGDGTSLSGAFGKMATVIHKGSGLWILQGLS